MTEISWKVSVPHDHTYVLMHMSMHMPIHMSLCTCHAHVHTHVHTPISDVSCTLTASSPSFNSGCPVVVGLLNRQESAGCAAVASQGHAVCLAAEPCCIRWITGDRRRALADTDGPRCSPFLTFSFTDRSHCSCFKIDLDNYCLQLAILA